MLYRKLLKHNNLTPYKIRIKESNILIYCKKPIKRKAKRYLKEARTQIEDYINLYPQFEISPRPLKLDIKAPSIIKSMLKASKSADVGPMASVAGAIAGYIGHKLLSDSDEVMVENGGDIFLKSSRERIIGVYAGRSLLSEKIAIRLPTSSKPYGVCTSSGTVGHSFSYGEADAVAIISNSCPYSDAWATKIANMIKKDSDIKKALKIIRKNPKILGGLIIKGGKLAVIGNIAIKNI